MGHIFFECKHKHMMKSGASLDMYKYKCSLLKLRYVLRNSESCTLWLPIEFLKTAWVPLTNKDLFEFRF